MKPASRKKSFTGLVLSAADDLYFVGSISQDNAKYRRQGVIDELLDRPHNPKNFDPAGKELKGAKYTILDTMTDSLDQAKAKQNAQDALARHPDLNCMVGLFAYNPPKCLDTVRDAGKLGKVRIVGFDEDKETLQGIKDGHIAGTVVQNPYKYGYESVRILAALARGDRSVLPANGIHDIPARTITAENLDAFWAEHKKLVGQQ